MFTIAQIGERTYALASTVTGHKIGLLVNSWEAYAQAGICPCDLGVFTLLDGGGLTCTVCVQEHKRAEAFAWEIVRNDLHTWQQGGAPVRGYTDGLAEVAYGTCPACSTVCVEQRFYAGVGRRCASCAPVTV